MLEPATSLQIGLLKQCRDHVRFMFRAMVWGLPNDSEDGLRCTFADFFINFKGSSAKRKKDFHTIRPLQMRGLDGVLL
jgi:hypothetical protein